MKTTKLFALLLVFTMVLGCMLLPVAADDPAPDVWDGTSATQPAGTGTETDPYKISNGAELKWIGDQVAAETANFFSNKYFIVTADIDLGGHEWTPIGYETAHSFRGIFDGQGHLISNFKVTTQKNAGLFGWVYTPVQLINLNLDDITVVATAGGAAGALVGYAQVDVIISNITVGKNVSVTGFNAGGVVGYFTGKSKDTIRYCVNNASVFSEATDSGEVFIGGIAGFANRVKISYCINNGAIKTTESGTNKYAGGIAGMGGKNNSVTKIEYCLNTGNIFSNQTAGGIAGRNYYDGCSYDNCVSTGVITKGRQAWSGTLVGRFSNTGSITNCYALADTAGIYGVIGADSSNAAKCTQTNVNICQTEEELKTLNVYAAAIQKAVAKQGTLRQFVIAEGVSFQGVQEYVHDGKFNVRFVSSVDDYTKYSDIGFTVTATYTDGTEKTKNFEKHCSSVYASLYAVNGDKVAYPEYAQEWQGNSLAAYSIRNIPATVGTVTFTVTPFYVEDGVRTAGQAYTVVYNNGEFVSATAVETAE